MPKSHSQEWEGPRAQGTQMPMVWLQAWTAATNFSPVVEQTLYEGWTFVPGFRGLQILMVSDQGHAARRGKVAPVLNQLPQHPRCSGLPIMHSSRLTWVRNWAEHDARPLGFCVRWTQQDSSLSASGAACDVWQETDWVLAPHLSAWTQCTRHCHPFPTLSWWWQIFSQSTAH